MAMVTERLNASKPPPDTKGGKLAPGALNNNKDLDVDVKEEPSFFGSFFNKQKAKRQTLTNGRPESPGAAPANVMSAMEQPPPTIRPVQALSDR